MQFASWPRLTHAQVHLRHIEGRDLAPWMAYLTLPQVYAHTSWDVHDAAELAGYEWRHEAATPSSMLRLAIARNADDVLVGTAGFHTVSPQNASAELTYDLAPAYWGQGIATVVCRELTSWAHANAGLVRVQATVLESNQRSMAVLTRCGFDREGLLRAYRMVRGRPGNFYMYAHVATTPTAPAAAAPGGARP